MNSAKDRPSTSSGRTDFINLLAERHTRRRNATLHDIMHMEEIKVHPASNRNIVAVDCHAHVMRRDATLAPSEITEIVGAVEFSERMKRRQDTLAAVARGLLKREIFVARR